MLYKVNTIIIDSSADVRGLAELHLDTLPELNAQLFLWCFPQFRGFVPEETEYVTAIAIVELTPTAAIMLVLV